MYKIVIALILVVLLASCDTVVFKDPLPTNGSKNLSEFPEGLRGVFVNKSKSTDTLIVTKTEFLYTYKSDSSNFKKISGTLNKDTYARNYKFNLFISKKAKNSDYYFVRNVLLRNGNVHFYRPNGYKDNKLIIKDLVFDHYYNETKSKHILKPTNKELDQLLTSKVFVQDKVFVPIRHPYYRAITETNNGCKSGNCTDGYGHYKYNNGFYKGFFKNGKRNGYGYYHWNDGQFYFGDWKDNERRGYGEHFYSTKSFYIGEWAKNKPNGHGYKIDKKGNSRIGIWQLGLLAFEFKFEFNKTNKGCTYGDCKDGYGRFFFDNGDYYIGFFRNGKPFLGEYNFTAGQRYRGQFTSDYKYNGSGYFLWQNQSFYRGKFLNGLKHGLGYYQNGENKSELKGMWAKDKIVKAY